MDIAGCLTLAAWLPGCLAGSVAPIKLLLDWAAPIVPPALSGNYLGCRGWPGWASWLSAVSWLKYINESLWKYMQTHVGIDRRSMKISDHSDPV